MSFLVGQLALVTAALFAGAALYVSVAEHPARMRLDDRAALAQWKPSYQAATIMQASLALASTVFALLALMMTGQWRWLAGMLLMLVNLPYTLLVILPTNKALEATEESAAGPASRRLLQHWSRLHALRTCFGVAATLADVWALS